jgi:hypothetical protein
MESQLHSNNDNNNTSHRAMKDYMQNLIHQVGGENAEVMIHFSPDNARIPIGNAVFFVSVETTILSYYSTSRKQIVTSGPPRAPPSRWSNSSPAVVAVEAAVRMMDSRSCLTRNDSSSSDTLKWKGIDNPAVRWPDDTRATTAATTTMMGKRNGNNVMLPVPTRISPKDLLQLSMGESPSRIPRKTTNNNNDRWTIKNTTCGPPSHPCRRSGSSSKWNNVHSQNDDRGQNLANVKTVGVHSTHPTGNSTPTTSGSSTNSRSVMMVLSPNRGGEEEELEISNNTVHAKNPVSLLSPAKHHYENHRINTLIQRLPNSLRASPY